MREMSEIFASARLQSTIDRNYATKRKKIRDAYSLIREYNSLENGEITDKIKEKAQEYFCSCNGMDSSEINPSEVPDERVLTCVNGIREKAGDYVLQFYRSYKRKADKEGYRAEALSNAYQDMQLSHRLYCLVNGLEENTKVTIEEIEELVSKINEDKLK